MDVKTAIEKAIEGGWSPFVDSKVEFIHTQSHYEDCFIVRALESGKESTHRLHKTLLDPLFWQSLGKAMGWEGRKYSQIAGKMLDEWQWQMLFFSLHLAEGKDAESFFETL